MQQRFTLFTVENEDFKNNKGAYLKWVVKNKGLKITVIAAKAGYDRTTFYNHIKDPGLPYTIMAKYGKAMEQDFSHLYKELPKEMDRNQKEINTFDEMKADRDYYKEKYDDLVIKFMEEIHKRKR